MMPPRIYLLAVLAVALTAGCATPTHRAGRPVTGRVFHVSVKGDDANDGSAARPLRTISAAAQRAQPGDTILVHEGIYRERVNPPRGGTGPDRRITYQAAEGQTVVITGSEPVTGWKRTDQGLWTVSLPESFFGDYNPYRDVIAGDWFNPRGRVHHTGEVYLDGKALAEEVSLEKVAATPMTWFCRADEQTTTLWANFGQADPADHLVEINVRPACFYPDRPGRNYITVRGFVMRHAATQWAAPTAEQIGLIGTHWSKGWVIEDCRISDSKCVGLTLGKDRASGHNNAQSAEGYNVVVRRALAGGWSKQNIGSHIVRRNVITNCGAAGICGSLGAVFSRITDNDISNICMNKPYGGAEMAGIKIHAAIDTLIRGNRIHHCIRGIWLDWMAQGARVSGNLCYDNVQDDLFVEVNHGPYLVENNLLLSKTSILDLSEGGAFVHNLIAGNIRMVPQGRQTPYHKPHSTEIAGLMNIRGGDNRFYNNLFVGGPGTKVYDKAQRPMALHGNVYLNGAMPCKQESDAICLPQFDAGLKLVEHDGQVHLSLTLPHELAAHKCRGVDTERLGKAQVPAMAFEHPDGSAYRLESDYFGRNRRIDRPFPGPFELSGTGRNIWPVWPITGNDR